MEELNNKLESWDISTNPKKTLDDDIDIDQLCESFMTQTKTLDDDDEWDNLIKVKDTLNSLGTIQEIRQYLSFVYQLIERYEASFVRDLHIHSFNFDHVQEIQNLTTLFINMWDHLIKYEKDSSSEDILYLRNIALQLFKYIIKSVNNYNG